jgi:hypothetical protein
MKLCGMYEAVLADNRAASVKGVAQRFRNDAAEL